MRVEKERAKQQASLNQLRASTQKEEVRRTEDKRKREKKIKK